MQDRLPNIIPVDKCEQGYLYRIEARNGSIGICIANAKNPCEIQFVLARWKFSWHYLWPEIHWDCDDHYGTAQPYEKIEKVPDEIYQLAIKISHTKEEEQAVLNYLDNHPIQLQISQDFKKGKWC